MAHLVHVHRSFFYLEGHTVGQLVQHQVPVVALALLERWVRFQLFKAGLERVDEALASLGVYRVLIGPDRINFFLCETVQ